MLPVVSLHCQDQLDTQDRKTSTTRSVLPAEFGLVSLGHEKSCGRDQERRVVLRRRDTVSNRDFAMATRTHVSSYRGTKASAIALHYLWRIGEAMVARRDRFERVYARADAVVPALLMQESGDAEADDFPAAQDGRGAGTDALPRGELCPAASGQRGRTQGLARPVDRRGRSDRAVGRGLERLAMGERADRGVLASIARGDVPAGWEPLETTTEEEATFLSPLDPASSRCRAKPLFDFDYKWEVYTPAAKRRFG